MIYTMSDFENATKMTEINRNFSMIRGYDIDKPTYLNFIKMHSLVAEKAE